ncbi:MAG: HAMP domain-containing sensor histidine kinase [Paracoccaceae bacterium]
MNIGAGDAKAAFQELASGSRPEFVWDPARLRLDWANDAGMRFWGEESLEALKERSFAPEEDAARVLAERMAAIEDGGSGDGVLFISPGAAPLSARARCRIEPGPDGRARLRVALEGVGAPDDSELALMRAGFEAAPRPLAIISPDGGVLARNAADRRAFPAQGGALADRYLQPEEARAALEAAMAAGGHSGRARLNCAYGAAAHRVTLRRMRDPATGGAAILAEFVETLDLPATSAPAEVDTSGMARLAHDLRSPLTAIQGFAEFMAMSGDSMDSARRAGYLADIQTASQRMLELVEALVALGAEAAGARPALDLRRVAEEAARLHHPATRAAGLTLNVGGSASATAMGDESAAHRIVGNLLANAIEHGRRPGGAIRLTVAVGQGGEEPSIEVSDDGPGMDEAALARALRPFGRGRAPGRRAGGLGLSNAATLAEEMGARLDISTAPGAGFVARLVCRPAP